MKNDDHASFIAQELMEQTGDAMLARDFEALKQHFELPLRLETVEGHRFITNEDELKGVFEAIVQLRADSGIEDFVRTVIFAEFVDPATIRSVHLCSEIHAGGELRRPAYPVHSTIVRRLTSWKILTATYVIHDDDDHNQALLYSGSKRNLRN